MRKRAVDVVDAASSQRDSSGGWKGRLKAGGDLLMTFCLAAMVLLPLLDIVLRSTTIVLPGSSATQ